MRSTNKKKFQHQIEQTPDHEAPKLVGVSAAKLQQKKFKPLQWVVQDFIPEGLTLLAGKPKARKSWLVLDVSVAVATGGECLDRQCSRGDVLYLALEDSQRRMQRRLRTMLGTEEWPRRLTIVHEAQRLDNGLIDQLKDWINNVKTPRLIGIDVLQHVRQPSGRNEGLYEADYRTVRTLQQFASETRVPILLAHHTRKAKSDTDIFETISGTFGITGAADSIVVLHKNPSTGDRELHCQGRDMRSVAVTLEQNDAMRWSVTGPAFDGMTKERADIIETLREGPLRTSEIAEALGKSPQNISNQLAMLTNLGNIIKTNYGKYRLRGFNEGDDDA